MKVYFITILWIGLCSLAAQPKETEPGQDFPSEGKEALDAQGEASEKWRQEDWTVFGEEGDIHFSKQTLRLVADSSLRTATFPLKYELEQIPDLLGQQKVMQALWTMINLYTTDREKVKNIALMLALRGIGPQHYLSAFYTYVFADPQVFHHRKNALPYMEYPLVMERKMDACRALASYSEAFAKRLNSAN